MCRRVSQLTLFTVTFRAFSCHFKPKRLAIITFVRREENNNITLSVLVLHGIPILERYHDSLTQKNDTIHIFCSILLLKKLFSKKKEKIWKKNRLWKKRTENTQAASTLSHTPCTQSLVSGRVPQFTLSSMQFTERVSVRGNEMATGSEALADSPQFVEKEDGRSEIWSYCI